MPVCVLQRIVDGFTKCTSSLARPRRRLAKQTHSGQSQLRSNLHAKQTKLEGYVICISPTLSSRWLDSRLYRQILATESHPARSISPWTIQRIGDRS